MIFKSPIAIGLSPNTQKDDVIAASKIIIQPWVWKRGNAIKEVEEWFKNYLNADEVFLFNSGRSALYTVLKSFGIGEGDEVLVQAFTCVAVPDPVIWAGAKPIFVDIDETLNINPALLEKHITSKTKAIIVQHTFGIPAKIEMIIKITRKYNLLLIEDCAHAFGAKINEKLVGTFGDAAIFSFGRDKVISSVFGGMAVINSEFRIPRPRPARGGQNSELEEFHDKLAYPSYFWIFQQLLHPIAFALILPLYNIYIGKIILFILQKLHLLSKPVYKEESVGEKPKVFPKRYPNALAQILLNQLNKLDKYNNQRREIANYYYKALASQKGLRLPPKAQGSIYLRFNILTDNAKEIFSQAKRRKIILGNWYRNVIDPAGVDLAKVNYKQGTCVNAQDTAKLSVNLPTYSRLTKSDLEQIVSLIKNL